MVDVYRTEEEQVDAIKRWFREYGLVTAIAILLAVGGTMGFRYYKQQQTKKTELASVLFDVVQVSQKKKDFARFNSASNQLILEHPKTPYAVFAAFFRARQAVVDRKFDSAEIALRWAMEHANNTSFQQVARLRLARVYLQENKNEEALALLKTVDNKSFEPVISEVKGDAFAALGKLKEAKAAYSNALSGIETSQPYRQMVEMKLYEVEGE